MNTATLKSITGSKYEILQAKQAVMQAIKQVILVIDSTT